jgi:octanoyl-[GcvH]:protein N-octanoyltransferase
MNFFVPVQSVSKWNSETQENGMTPVLDMAVSHALLMRVAERTRPPATRVYEPGPTVAFSKLDSHAEGFAAACDAARSHGFEPVVRLGGGHAAAYGPGCLIWEEIVTHDSVLEGLHERYVRATGTLAAALWELGAPVVVGALEGEYCAGAHSLHAGEVKVAGLSQRVVKGAALTSSVVLLDAGPAIRAVLVDVYSALGIEWRPSTAGSLADVAPAPALEDVAAALAPGGAGLARIGDEDLRLAAELEPRHRP